MFGPWVDEGSSVRRAGGMSRRDCLRIGALNWLGLVDSMLPSQRRSSLTQADDTNRPLGKAKRCVFIFLFGGPSHIDLWDMKPLAPANVRGIFQPIATTVPGIELSELLPHLAKEADKLCLLRSMTHGDPVHGTACSQVITGRPHRRPGTTDTLAPDDWPSLSALVNRFGRAPVGMPPSVVLPWYLMFPSQGARIAGQSGALMGEQHNAFLVDGDPSLPDFSVPGMKLPTEIPVQRLLRRKGLLQQVEATDRRLTSGIREALLNEQYQTAFSMVSDPRAASAFDIQSESPELRQRYGSSKFGQSLLLARRLVERGVSLVTVNWDDESRDEKQSPFWDTHHDNFGRLKRLSAIFDQPFATFLADLHEHGLLDETLVVWTSEFGRTPWSQNTTGRDHNPKGYTSWMAGGGIKGGIVHGGTDEVGYKAVDSPHYYSDLHATILHQLGLNHKKMEVQALGRTMRLVEEGGPIKEIIA